MQSLGRCLACFAGRRPRLRRAQPNCPRWQSCLIRIKLRDSCRGASRHMDKRVLGERDILHKLHHACPARSGWDEMLQISEEVSFTKGRIIVRGKLVHARPSQTGRLPVWPFGLSVRYELKHNTIHAITQPGRVRTVFENMSKMASAAAAVNLGARQEKEAAVLRRSDRPLDRRPEARPASFTLKFGG